MYGANLSWKPLQQIIKSLVDQELVLELESEERDQRTSKIYNITEKGQNVLRYFGKAKDLLIPSKPLEALDWR